MKRLLMLTVTLVCLTLFSATTQAGYISGKVFWDEALHSDGASYAWVYAIEVGNPQNVDSTETNCCGLYAITGLDTSKTYDMSAKLYYNQADPCSHVGEGCDYAQVAGPAGVQPDAEDVDIDLGLSDCTNSQTPCDDPCP
jgi:hypothetical protein